MHLWNCFGVRPQALFLSSLLYNQGQVRHCRGVCQWKILNLPSDCCLTIQTVGVEIATRTVAEAGVKGSGWRKDKAVFKNWLGLSYQVLVATECGWVQNTQTWNCCEKPSLATTKLELTIQYIVGITLSLYIFS